MTDKASESFPISINFGRDPITVTFESAGWVLSWLSNEKAFWSRIGDAPNEQYSQVVGTNSRLLGNVKPEGASDPDLIQKLRILADQYIPSQSSLGRIAEGLSKRGNPTGARAAVAWFISPQQTPWQNNPAIMEGILSAIAYRNLGSEQLATERLEGSISEVEALKAQHITEIQRFQDIIRNADEDWKKKIQGFEAQVALEAPREYWAARAEHHRNLAATAAGAWGWWLLVFVAISGIGGLLFFTQIGAYALEFVEKRIGIPIVTPLIPAGSEGFSLLADLLRRALIFGTLLTVGVWWLRQKLRDLRSHEHLAEDAAERVTMIETYAAMKGQGLSPNDLGLVLAALYRPASTGLVDDAGPTLPFEILMNATGNVVSRSR